jgi:hypothetical protein
MCTEKKSGKMRRCEGKKKLRQKVQDVGRCQMRRKNEAKNFFYFKSDNRLNMQEC